MIYYSFSVIFVVVTILGASKASPIGEISVSYGPPTAVNDPTDNSVYGDDFADVSGGYKKDEALKVSKPVKVIVKA